MVDFQNTIKAILISTRKRGFMKQEKYYLVWVAPNSDFPEQRLDKVVPFDSFMVAKGIASQMNKETKGVQGTYEVRKETA